MINLKIKKNAVVPEVKLSEEEIELLNNGYAENLPSNHEVAPNVELIDFVESGYDLL